MRSVDLSHGPGNPTFKAFQDLLSSGAPEAAAVREILGRLKAEGLTEAALAVLRKVRSHAGSHRDSRWEGLRLGLESAAEKARGLRLQQWQLDPGRRTFRFCFEVLGPASELNPSALLHTLVQAFLEAGLPVAMGLEKTPRPMVSLGPPLPLGAEGLAEWADCVLREPSALPAEEWPSRLAAHCPPGLRFLSARLVPNHSSTLLELAREARWRWECPEDLQGAARPRLEAFLRASSFEIDISVTVSASHDRESARRAARRNAAQSILWYAGADQYGRQRDWSVPRGFAVPAATIEALSSRWDMWTDPDLPEDLAALITDDVLDQFTVWGEPEDCARRLRALAAEASGATGFRTKLPLPVKSRTLADYLTDVDALGEVIRAYREAERPAALVAG